jgi:hypothetical protein
MRNFPLLDDLTVRIENADLMYFGATINTDKKTMSDFVQWIILLNGFGLPQPTSPLYWRSRRKLPTGL